MFYVSTRGTIKIINIPTTMFSPFPLNVCLTIHTLDSILLTYQLYNFVAMPFLYMCIAHWSQVLGLHTVLQALLISHCFMTPRNTFISCQISLNTSSPPQCPTPEFLNFTVVYILWILFAGCLCSPALLCADQAGQELTLAQLPLPLRLHHVFVWFHSGTLLVCIHIPLPPTA